jgi:glycosyltransferase involved in cell wall biosynthesis
MLFRQSLTAIWNSTKGWLGNGENNYGCNEPSWNTWRGKMKPLGVAIIISWFYPYIGGAERQAYQLATRLSQRGVPVYVLTRRHRGLASFESLDSVPVHRLPAPGNRIVASAVFTLAALLWLAWNRNRWSVLHTFQLLSPTTVAVLAKSVLGGHVVARMACSSGGGTRYGDVNHIREGPFVGLRRRLLRRADVFIVLNDEGRRDLVDFELSDRSIQSIPNGVDAELFCPLSGPSVAEKRRSLDLPLEGRFVVFVGRLHPAKGLDVLLNAWRQVVVDLTEAAYLIIIGEGELRSKLETQAGDLAPYVIFLGRRDKVVDYLQVADVFALPSRAEGLSNALLEAMACGLPVVATAVGGAPEVIEDNVNGRLVPLNDALALSNAISHFIQHPEQARQLGEMARRTIQQRYSIDAMVDRYVNLYASLME